MRYIAAYGSLRKGDYNYERFKKGLTYIETRTIAGFSMYNLGPYPAAVNTSSIKDNIVVDIIKTDDKTYSDIYGMEVGAGYIPMSMVIPINTEKGMVNTSVVLFYMKKENINGLHVPSGDWFNKNLKNKRKIYVVGGAYGYTSWMEGEIVDKLSKADLVVFTGGEDIDPSLYDEEEHYTTRSNIDRDMEEMKYFKEAVKLDKQIIGCCRGGQFLGVMNGGKLIQHMSHPSNHKIMTYDGKTLEATSTHHQMQYPYNLPDEDYKILAWSLTKSPFHLGGTNEEMNPEKDCEIVYYPKTKCLAIQMHPEFFNVSHETVTYLRELLDNIYGEGNSREVQEKSKEEVQS